MKTLASIAVARVPGTIDGHDIGTAGAPTMVSGTRTGLGMSGAY